ncbi:MAG: TauD/TfdA family dioxygenase [Luminiphilus sp.]|nr:TauD/TfdA family dioxygenase [Luminiphilus sp.]
MKKRLTGSIPFMTETDWAIEPLLRRLPFRIAPAKRADNFPLELTPSGADQLADGLSEAAIDVMSVLDRVGAILFRGFHNDGDAGFDRCIEALNLKPFTYAESLSNAVRKNRTARVFTANEAPPDLEIFLHHEMAQTPIFPRYLFFYCEHPAATGGATPLCRSDHLMVALERQLPSFVKQCRDLGVSYTHTMPAQADSGSGQGRSWLDTLSVSSRVAAESKLQQLGYSWAWLAGDDLRVTTPALPAIRHTNTGTEVFFNQLVAAFAGWEDQRNSAASSVSFGDGSSMPLSALKEMVTLAYQQVYDHFWHAGDVVLLDNLRVMHGRRPYSGSRTVLAGLAGPQSH